MSPSHLHQRPDLARPATIGYLNVQSGSARHRVHGGDPPSSPSTSSGLAADRHRRAAGRLHVDFDLRKSIQVDSSGQITGVVTPNFDVNAVVRATPAPTSTSSTRPLSAQHHGAVVCRSRPHGRQFTINVTGSTSGEQRQHHPALHQQHRADLGILDKVDATIDADEVAILSQDASAQPAWSPT